MAPPSQAVSVRRLVKRDLSRGWLTWHGVFSEAQRKRRVLRSAANRLSRPKLTAAYTLWRQDWKAHTVSTHTKRLGMEEEARRVVEAELQRALQELAQTREALTQALARSSGYDEDVARRLEQEKEKSVAHLQQVGVRRLLKQGLARGWGAWHEMHAEAMRKRQLLAKVGGRLLKPKLSACFTHWLRDYQLAAAAERNMSSEERLKAKMAERMSVEEELQREIVRLRKELAAAKEALQSQAGHEDLVRQEMEAKMELEKEKRVDHLQKIGMKRLMNAGLARGWSAWHGLYAERRRKRNMLRQVGARLTKPKLLACYAHWRKGWEIEVHVSRTMTHAERLAAEEANSQALQQELNGLRKELEAARQAMLDGRGQEAELKRQMGEALEQEKEKRVNHLQQMGVKRLMNAGLARGWSAWHGVYAERRRKLNMLKQAGSRVARPKLAAAYHHWLRDWDAAVVSAAAGHAKLAAMTSEQRLAVQMLKAQELEKANGDLERELGEARRAMAEGRGMEAERQRLSEAELEREKEKRVEHLKQLAIRRIAQRDLSRGWNGWHGLWAELARRRKLLRQAASRLARPALVGAYMRWRVSWLAESHHKAAMGAEERLAAAHRGEAEAEATCRQLRKELAELKKAVSEGRGNEGELKRQMEEALEQEKEKRVAHLQHVGVRRLLKQGLARGWGAWHELYSERTHKLRLLRKASSALAKPKLAASYGHWRHDWQLEQARAAKAARESRAASAKELTHTLELQLRGQLKKLAEELGEARRAMAEGRGQEAELKRRMEEALEGEKEKRVAHLQQLGLKRLMNAGLARGWSAWHEVYSRGVRTRQVLMRAAARLTRPKLAAAYTLWWRDWEMVGAEARRLEMRTEAQRLEDEARALRREATEERARRAAAEERMAHERRQAEDELMTTREELMEARKNATDAMRKAAAAQAGAEQARKAQATVDELEQERLAELERRVKMESEVARLRSEAEEEIAMQRVALVEARKAATDALYRASQESAQGEAARNSYQLLEVQLRDARNAEVSATEAAIKAQGMLGEHQQASEQRLHELLEVHREHLTKEIMRVTEDYEQKLAELRLQLSLRAKPEPPPPLQVWMPPPASSQLRLVHDPTKRLATQLAEQIRLKGLRSVDLFREMDVGNDGYLSRAEWTEGIGKLGHDLDPKAIEEVCGCTPCPASACRRGAVEGAQWIEHARACTRHRTRMHTPPHAHAARTHATWCTHAAHTRHARAHARTHTRHARVHAHAHTYAHVHARRASSTPTRTSRG